MTPSISNLPFTGVVPAICDAEAGQEDAPDPECLLGGAVYRPQRPAWSSAASEFALCGLDSGERERPRED